MVRATWVMVFVFPVFSVLAVEMDSLSLTTAICDDCGMTTWFGRVAAKICGLSDCCYTGFLDGRFDEGIEDKFCMAGRGDCGLLDVDSFGENGETLSVTVYHRGTDEVRFSHVSIAAVDDRVFECQFPFKSIDDEDFVLGQACQRIK